MKSKLTEWISKAVQEMNLSRKEKIIKCYADTGILDAWSPQKNDLYEEAVEKRHSLFPNMIDQSWLSNDTGDQQEMTGLAVRMEQSVDKDTGVVTLAEREDDIENQLVQHVTNHAASIVVSESACDGHDDNVQDVPNTVTGGSKIDFMLETIH